MLNVIGAYNSLDVPHLQAPVNPPVVFPTFVTMTCGQDITADTLEGVSSLSIQCASFNGSEPLTTEVYKDGELIGNSFPLSIIPASDDDFGTYTFVLSNECGIDVAVSRILRQG